jgi:hypothetical protein
MDASTLAVEAVEIISHLKDELAKPHNRIVELEQQVEQKEQCVQEPKECGQLRVA